MANTNTLSPVAERPVVRHRRGRAFLTGQQKEGTLRSVRLLLRKPTPSDSDYAKVLIALSVSSLMELHCLVAGRYCEWANGAPVTITNDDIRAAIRRAELALPVLVRRAA